MTKITIQENKEMLTREEISQAKLVVQSLWEELKESETTQQLMESSRDPILLATGINNTTIVKHHVEQLVDILGAHIQLKPKREVFTTYYDTLGTSALPEEIEQKVVNTVIEHINNYSWEVEVSSVCLAISQFGGYLDSSDFRNKYGLDSRLIVSTKNLVFHMRLRELLDQHAIALQDYKVSTIRFEI